MMFCRRWASSFQSYSSSMVTTRRPALDFSSRYFNARTFSKRFGGGKRLPLFTATPKAKVTVGVLAGGIFLYFIFKKKKKACKKRSSNADAATVKDTATVREGRFTNKCVVITGGAGDMGSSVALAFSQEGAYVVLVDLHHTKRTLEEKCKALQAAGAKRATYIEADVTSVADIQSMVNHVIKERGKIDIFFNNAGIQGKLRPLPEQDDVEVKRLLDVNIYGVFLGMKYISRAMKESGEGGVIINTASMAGLCGPSNMVAYTASKYAVVGMTKTASKDLAQDGIRVCAIAPGILEGGMWETQVRGRIEVRKRLDGDDSDITKEEYEAMEKEVIRGTPMQRLGKMSEVASVVTFLCSDDASYLTGITVPIEGGRLQ